MRRRYYLGTLAAVALVATVVWSQRYRFTPATTLSVNIGDSYEHVIESSTYVIRDHSMAPDGKDGFGAVWIDTPAVQVRFSDPLHGFTLPPTKFAMVTLLEYKVTTITTSPMLDPLPFNEAIALLNRLQADFKKAGWEPIERSGERPPTWFDTQTAMGLAELRTGNTRELVVGDKYRMYFNFKCWDECYPEPNAKSVYLIDVSIGDMLVSRKKQK
jgi:hypothetical protein